MYKIRRFCLLLALFLLLTPGLPVVRASAYEANPIIKVGLYYNLNALPAANLQNYTGSGYRVGYFNTSREFVSVWAISDIKITMLKDKNYNKVSGVFYDGTPVVTANVLGAYHLQIPSVYSTIADAKVELERLTAAGVPAFPAYINGKYSVRIGDYVSAETAATAAAGYTAAVGATPSVTGCSSTCYTVINSDTKKILFEFDYPPYTFGVTPEGGSQKAQTWFKGYRYYGAFEYRRNNGNDLTVINVVNLNDYVKGVIPYEINPNWNIETQKALAVCARTYALANRGKHGSYGFDVCNSTDCQVYRGANGSTTLSDSAANAVSGIYLSYADKLCTAYYHSSNGGSTEDAVNVWSNNIPYLKAVRDNFETLTTANNGIWQKTYTTEELKTLLGSKGYGIGTISAVYVERYTAAGNVYRLTVKDTLGKAVYLEKEKARTILGLNSIRYKVLTGGGVRTSNAVSTGSVSGGLTTVNAVGTFYVNDSFSPLPSTINNAYAIGSRGVDLIQGSVITVLSGTGGDGKYVEQQYDSSTLQSGSYCFDGTGWGHNVGLSQLGAKGMGDRGYKYDEILKFYYTGVTVGP